MNQLEILHNRFKKVKEILLKTNVSAIFLSSSVLVQYFTDSQSIEGYLLINHYEIILITDPRYIQETKYVPAFISVEIFENNIITHLKNKKYFQKGRIGISGDISFSFYQKLNAISWKNKLIDISTALDSIFSIHDALSIARMKKAIAISKKVFQIVKQEMHTGITEIEIASEISHRSRTYGASRDAFEPIVAFEKNSAMPHAVPTKKKLKDGDVVLIDMGCVYKNINSDFTRTFVFGRQNHKFVDVFNVISEIVAKVSTALRPGVFVKELDEIARVILKSYNLEQYFTHALGHGLGLQVHQKPRISKFSNEMLQPGHIITIEPGIYFPDAFGVRLENIYLINDNSSINLTKF